MDIWTLPRCQRPQPASPAPPAEGSHWQPVVDDHLASWLRDTAPAFDGALASLARWHGVRVQGLQAAAAAARRDLWWPFTQHTSVCASLSLNVSLSVCLIASLSGIVAVSLRPSIAKSALTVVCALLTARSQVSAYEEATSAGPCLSSS